MCTPIRPRNGLFTRKRKKVAITSPKGHSESRTVKDHRLLAMCSNEVGSKWGLNPRMVGYK